MSESSALSELVKKLEQNKKQELDQIKQIEAESMSELAKYLRASLETELDLIKADITKMQEGIIANNKTLAENTESYSTEIVQNFRSMSQELTKLKAKQWIIPTVMGLALVLALALGTWGVTKYLSSQVQALIELREKKAEIENMSQVLQVYQDGIELYQEPKVWQNKKGTWIVKIED